MISNFLQFELWHDCSNGCLFCHNKGSSDIAKNTSLNYIIDQLNCKTTYDGFNEIGLIGGEIFDKQLIDSSVHTLFYKLISLLTQMIHNNIFTKLYIATGLMFYNTKFLIEFLDFIIKNKISDKVLLCTSYDTIGRFINEERKINWHNNMTMLSTMYPNIMKHVEIILSGDFIKKCLKNEFNISNFKQTYNCEIDYISPHIISYDKRLTNDYKNHYNNYINDFFPRRSDFLKFVTEFAIKKNDIKIWKFLSNDIRADRVYMIYDKKHVVIDNRRKTDGVFAGMDKKLGISYIDGYIDSDIRMEDDVKSLIGNLI